MYACCDRTMLIGISGIMQTLLMPGVPCDA